MDVRIDTKPLADMAAAMRKMTASDLRRVRDVSEKAARPMIGEIKMRARTRADAVSVRGSRIVTGAQGESVVVALLVGQGAPAYGPSFPQQREFGGDREHVGSVILSGKVAKRHTQRHLPPPYAKGRMTFPTVKVGFKTLTSAWLGALVLDYRKILEG